MGRGTFTRASYEATRASVASDSSYTARAERQFRDTGKLNPLVDPKGYGVIRRSLPRFEECGSRFRLAMPVPVPVEVRFDTTGSMGHNVQVAFDVLPDLYDLLKGQALSRYDIQIAMGIFGDIVDPVVLCRSQFEMDEKIAQQLTYMTPYGGGGDSEEDPHYGLFGAAYLTAPYINQVGLKGYDFTISDAPMHDRLDEKTLVRVFGEEVFDKVIENGHQINRKNLPTIREMVQDLLTRTHAFFLQVGSSQGVTRQWSNIMGEERVIVLPETKLLPQVISAVIGLTEGVLDLQSIDELLRSQGVSKENAKRITRSVANIPIGAQAALPNFDKLPQAGDIFAEKTDVWPTEVSPSSELEPVSAGEEGKWL